MPPEDLTSAVSVAGAASVPLHHLATVTAIYDLSTDELQAKLSELVRSVSSSPPASLDGFLLVEQQILLIHQELRERHLSAALAQDPWMDSELDDVHVGQRERQAQDAAREAAEVERQIVGIREEAAGHHAAPSQPQPAPSLAEQQWVNHSSDRRALDAARRRTGSESGAVRVLKAAIAAKKPIPAAATKSKSVGHAHTIPENILNQRREMVIMTSSVENRRVNRSKHESTKTKAKKDGSSTSSPPLSPSSSPPSSKRSMGSERELKRSSSTSRTKAKPQLSANQKAKLYAEAQRQEAASRLKERALKSSTPSTALSAASTATSSPRAFDSHESGSHSSRPLSIATTEIDESHTETNTSNTPNNDTPLQEEGTQRHDQHHINPHVDDSALDLGPNSDGAASDSECDDSPTGADPIAHPLARRAPSAYDSMDHAAIETAQAHHRLLSNAAIMQAANAATAATPAEPYTHTQPQSPNDESHDAPVESSVGSIPVTAFDMSRPALLSVIDSSRSSVYEDDLYSDSGDLSPRDASESPNPMSAPDSSTQPTDFDQEWAAARTQHAQTNTNSRPIAKPTATTAATSTKRIPSSSNSRLRPSPTAQAAIDSAVEASRARVARSNPKKAASEAIARINKNRDTRRSEKEKDQQHDAAGKGAALPAKVPLTKSISGDKPVSSGVSTDVFTPASTAVVLSRPKRPPKPPLVTLSYEPIFPSIEYIFSAMWSAGSSSGANAGQNWFSALVTHIAQCEKFKLAFGGSTTGVKRTRAGSAHARNRLIGATAAERAAGTAADEVRLEYLTGSIIASGSTPPVHHKLNGADARTLEHSRLLKAHRSLDAVSTAADPTHTPPPAALDSDDESIARDFGPGHVADKMIFLVTHEREEVYTVVRQALLNTADDDEDDSSPGAPSDPLRRRRVWVECPVEDAPKPDRLFPFLPPNFTNAVLGAAPAHATPQAQIPLYAQLPSGAPPPTGLLAPAAGVEFSSTAGQFHELSSGSASVSASSSRSLVSSATPALYWNLLWTWKKPHIDYSKLLSWQKVNHFPDSRCLTRKDLLKKQIERYSQHRGWKHAREWNIMPQSFILPQEYQQFIETFSKVEIESRQSTTPIPNYWICKPPSLSRGRGIFITNSLDDIDFRGEPLLIQKYVLNPLLLNGYKFDLRLYVVVTSVQPLEVFLYKEGFARISTTKWSASEKDLKNKFIHLTNSSVQKNNILGQDGKEIGGAGAEKRPNQHATGNLTGDARFDHPASQAPAAGQQKQTLDDDIFRDPLGDGGSKISLAHLWRHLRSTGVDTDALWQKIIRVVLKTLVAIEDDFTPSVNSFELFGFDILLTSDLEAHLIEVNASPSMGLDTPLDQVIKPRLIRDIVGLVRPIPTHRYFLQHLLERRFKSGYFESTPPKSRDKKVQSLNELCHHLLTGEKPRLVGEMPTHIGLFDRIAPMTSAYDAIIKMKRTAFQPTTNVEHKYKRTLPPIV